jgi:hypothetical protein
MIRAKYMSSCDISFIIKGKVPSLAGLAKLLRDPSTYVLGWLNIAAEAAGTTLRSNTGSDRPSVMTSAHSSSEGAEFK